MSRGKIKPLVMCHFVANEVFIALILKVAE